MCLDAVNFCYDRVAIGRKLDFNIPGLGQNLSTSQGFNFIIFYHKTEMLNGVLGIFASPNVSLIGKTDYW